MTRCDWTATHPSSEANCLWINHATHDALCTGVSGTSFPWKYELVRKKSMFMPTKDLIIHIARANLVITNYK